MDEREKIKKPFLLESNMKDQNKDNVHPGVKPGDYVIRNSKGILK